MPTVPLGRLLPVLNSSSGQMVKVVLTGSGGVGDGLIQVSVRKGSATMTYEREFSFSGVAVASTQAGIRMQSPALAPLEITWLRLRFENGRAETTVPRYQPRLQIFADFNYVGSGLLQGYWEVDGRRFSDFSKTLRYSRQTITLASPKLPGLPTFETGTHRVRLVIVSPAQTFKMPTALYFVEAKEYGISFLVTLLTPSDGSYLPLAPLTFTWRGKPEMKTYVVEFFRVGENDMFFSAQTRQPSYSIPPVLFPPRFGDGKSFNWRVLGMGEDGKAVGQSRLWRVHFKK